jgi:hypothetical protein
MVSLFAGRIASGQNFPTAAVTPLAGTPLIEVSADFNRDGHLDIAYLGAFSGGNLHVLLGKGDGTFGAGQILPLAAGAGGNITVGDVNADGIADLVIGYGGGGPPLALTTLIGKGDGTFGSPVPSAVTSYVSPATLASKVGIADFDGDGVPDLIYSDGYEFLYFMEGNGQGNFGTPVRFPAFDSTKWVGYGMGDIYVYDLNGDGLPDLVGPGGNGINVLLGMGAAKFAPPVTYTTTGGLNLADFDRDGHIDGITCNTTTGNITVSYGRSDGTFASPVSVGNVPNHEGFVTGIADLHGDHNNRIVVASPDGVSITLGATPGVTETYAGSFAQNIVAFSATNQYLLGDFNEDGLTDIEMPANNAIAILFGKPDGTFNGGVSIETGGYIGVGGVQMIDVTGDSIPDAVLTTSAIFQGIGDGTFTKLPNYNTFPTQETLYPADFNGDGKIDFLSYETLYYNQGNGTFTTQTLTGLANGNVQFTNGFFAIGDFNHDGKPDIAASMTSNSNIVNGLAFATSTPGANTFNYSYFNLTEVPQPLGAGDFDGDHCDDIAAATQTQILILKSDCFGNFKQVGSYPTGYSGSPYLSPFNTSLDATDSIVTDLDGDGHLDIVYTISGASVARVLYGNGDGTFTPGSDIVLAHASSFVTAGDLDNDGRPDLVFSGHGLVTILHGQPNRTFSAPQYLAGGYETGKVALADLRAHGRLDIAVPNLGVEGNLTNEQGYSFAVFLNPLPSLNSNVLNVQLTVAPEPSPYGQPFTATATFTPASNNHIPIGTAVFTLDNGSTTPGVLNSSGVATATFPLASVGTHSVAVTYPGDSHFAAVSTSTPHVVAAIPTLTSLTCSPSSILVNGTALLTATVTSSSGIPTGSIAFTDSGAVLATQSLLSGTTSVQYTGSIAGTHTLISTYLPTGAFAASSATCSELVNLPSSFTITLSPTTITLPAGATGTIAIQLASIGNFAGPLSLTYGPLPRYATASVSPATVTLTPGGTASSVLTLNTLLKASNAIPAKPGSNGLPLALAALAILFIPFQSRPRKKVARLVGVVLTISALQAVSGCANAWYTANAVTAGTYQIPVVATDVNQNSHTATLIVIVNP